LASANSTRSPLFFYQFLGSHSLLIGLLPFFLPVFLWQHGVGLAGLSLLIAVSGFSFVLVLSAWQRIWNTWNLKWLITIAFALELLLVASAGWFTTIPGASLFNDFASETNRPLSDYALAMCVIGAINGLYNAFFWTTQRSLFLQQLGNNDTGKQYGNFQIFVTVFLKIGILLGGWLLDLGGFTTLLALSAGVSFAANSYLANKFSERAEKPIIAVSLQRSLRYEDAYGSRKVFAIDGIFLYLESHFWTLSLFLLVKEDFSNLGLAVVVLALIFALVFYLIKNRIDKLSVERVYIAAVALYAASWLLRFTLDMDAQGTGYLVALILITFCSSFFRLAFNKRFFDVAKKSGQIEYLLIKSYSSQFVLGLVFLMAALAFSLLQQEAVLYLQYSYVAAAFLSLVYLNYRDH